MKVDFYFDECALNKAVVYLRDVSANPAEGKTDIQVKDLVKRACVEKFEKMLSGKQVQSFEVNDGVIHGAVVWRGLLCKFGSVDSCSGPNLVHEQNNIDVEGGSRLDCVTVDLYVNVDGELTTDFSEMTNGVIETSENDDLRSQRDRMLSLVQNCKLETDDYRCAVKMLTTANNIIERLNAGESVGSLSCIWETTKSVISD